MTKIDIHNGFGAFMHLFLRCLIQPERFLIITIRYPITVSVPNKYILEVLLRMIHFFDDYIAVLTIKDIIDFILSEILNPWVDEPL